MLVALPAALALALGAAAPARAPAAELGDVRRAALRLQPRRPARPPRPAAIRAGRRARAAGATSTTIAGDPLPQRRRRSAAPTTTACPRTLFRPGPTRAAGRWSHYLRADARPRAAAPPPWRAARSASRAPPALSTQLPNVLVVGDRVDRLHPAAGQVHGAERLHCSTRRGAATAARRRRPTACSA